MDPAFTDSQTPSQGDRLQGSQKTPASSGGSKQDLWAPRANGRTSLETRPAARGSRVQAAVRFRVGAGRCWHVSRQQFQSRSRSGVPGTWGISCNSCCVTCHSSLEESIPNLASGAHVKSSTTHRFPTQFPNT
uniref:Uncharacterized protein n=1 Tax=Molossus molossus TaxID=27622 RepID=A0A7J8FAT1_MOLMO|nr:hypothetical protein HJG59_008613 [Molossus molossus]